MRRFPRLCGGFAGWRNGTVNITDLLFAPSEITVGTDGSATFSRNGAAITKSCYTQTFGDAQGLQGYTVTADEGITLTESGGKYSLTMPEGNVTISAEFAHLYSITISEAIMNGTITAYKAQAVEGGTRTLTVTVDKITAEYGDVVTLPPAEGYEAENLTVMAGDSAVTVTGNADGTYSFTGLTLDGGNDDPAITVTIDTGTTGDLAYTANWQKNGFSPEDFAAPEFAYHSLLLSGQVGVIFYVYAPEGLASKDCCVYFDVSGDKSQNTQPVYAFETMTDDGKNFLGFKCYINSIQMADKIHAELHYKDANESEQTITHDYTAKQYLTRIINDTTQSADTRELGRAIIDFGSYVQPVLAKENGWEIGRNHAEMTTANNYNDTDFSA